MVFLDRRFTHTIDIYITAPSCSVCFLFRLGFSRGVVECIHQFRRTVNEVQARDRLAVPSRMGYCSELRRSPSHRHMPKMQVGTCPPPRARASHRGMYFTSKPPLLPLLHCSYTTFFNHSARCPTVCDRYDRDFLQLYAEQSDNTTPAIYPCFELPFSCLPFKLLLLSILKVVIWDWETVWVPR